MESLFIPDYLLVSQEEFDQNLKQILDITVLLHQLKADKITECEFLDLMIESAEQCTDEMLQLQMESTRTREAKQQRTKEVDELALCVADIQEEIETEKMENERLEEQIKIKSDFSIKLNTEIKKEELRIETLKQRLKTDYKYHKKCVQQFATLFNCDLSSVNKENTLFRLTLKDDELKDRVSIVFQMNQKDLELKDIQPKCGSMDPELKDHIQEMMNEFQDTQGLLVFLHKTYVKK